MKSVDTDSLAFRLLELEQKLDSYTALYEEELVEIEEALNQLRQDILTVQREKESEQTITSSDGTDQPSNGGGSDSRSLAL